MKQTVSEQALALVEKKLSDLKGALTPQDAAAATGLAVSEARDALTRLMELYITRVTADDQGNVLFAFEYPLRERGTKTFSERWVAFRARAWKTFKAVYKVVIGVMVIVYFGVMAIVLLLIIIALSKVSDSDDDSAGDLVGGLFRGLFEGIGYAFWFRPAPVMVMVDDYGYSYRGAKTPRGVGKRRGAKGGREGSEKSFVIGIYDLALGPERVAADPLADEREVAAFLKEENGIITPSEIVGLSGVSIDKAEERMADYLVRFNGDPTITEEGAVVGEFESYTIGRSAGTGDRVIPYWDEYEPPFEHSGNSAKRNVGILAMVGFTGVVGLGVLGGGLQVLAAYGSFFTSGFAKIFLGYGPIIFALSYVLISLLRLPGVQRNEAARLRRNREKKAMRVIFQSRLWSATADQIASALLERGDRDIPRDQLPSIMESLLKKLQGQIELGPNGEAIYSFERLRREIEAADAMRGGRKLEAPH